MPEKEPKDTRNLPREKIDEITQKAINITGSWVSKEDPQGSYTGRPVIPGEVPVQDADDL